MKKIFFIALCCFVFSNKAAQENRWITSFKKGIRVPCALLEPPSGAFLAVSSLSLVSHATRGSLSEGMKDPVVAQALLAAGVFSIIRTFRTTSFMKSCNEDCEQSINNWEAVAYCGGLGSVSYYVYRHSPEGLFTVTGARMLCQPALDMLNVFRA